VTSTPPDQGQTDAGARGAGVRRFSAAEACGPARPAARRDLRVSRPSLRELRSLMVGPSDPPAAPDAPATSAPTSSLRCQASLRELRSLMVGPSDPPAAPDSPVGGPSGRAGLLLTSGWDGERRFLRPSRMGRHPHRRPSGRPWTAGAHFWGICGQKGSSGGPMAHLVALDEHPVCIWAAKLARAGSTGVPADLVPLLAPNLHMGCSWRVP